MRTGSRYTASFLIRVLPPFIWGGIIMWISLIPSPPVPRSGLLGWDKFQHASGYAGLTFFCALMVPHLIRNRRRGLFLAALGATGYGGLVEIAQGLFTVTRTAEWGDLAANAFGSFSMLTLLLLYDLLTRRAADDGA